jgi:CelD/BcsL family acetyltransferase involved in cellulose biosynthesis
MCFDLFIQFSLKSFLARKRKSRFSDTCHNQFLKDFFLTMACQSRLDTHILCVADTPIAISFGYRFGKGFNWVLTGFDYTYRHLNPGYLLIEALIEEVHRRGETFYNWYGHDRFYKKQWCNDVTPLYRLKIINQSIYARMLSSVEESLRSSQRARKVVRRFRAQ